MNRRSTAYYRSPLGWIRVETSGRALRSASFVPAAPRTRPSRTAAARRWIKRLQDYFAGRPVRSEPLCLEGTAFQRRVWRRLASIPRGRRISYQRLARLTGRPKAVRAVANAVGANPAAILVPCHRVVRKSGRLGGYASGVWRKRWLLRHENARAEEAS